MVSTPTCGEAGRSRHWPSASDWRPCWDAALVEPRLPCPLPLAESRRAAADLIRQTSGAPKAPGRSVRFGSLLPSVPHVPRIAPHNALHLLCGQPATEQSPRVNLGALDERLAQALVQPGAALLIGVSRPLLGVFHAGRVAAPGRPARVPSSEETGEPGAEPGSGMSLGDASHGRETVAAADVPLAAVDRDGSGRSARKERCGAAPAASQSTGLPP
jgi:hypothetical protein